MAPIITTTAPTGVTKASEAHTMKALILAVVLGIGFMTPATAASWGYRGMALDVQAYPDKGRPGRGQEQGQRGRDSREGRQAQQDPRKDQQLNEDERRALHRDLDKANRELYRRR
jgi:hypothetical protein